MALSTYNPSLVAESPGADALSCVRAAVRHFGGIVDYAKLNAEFRFTGEPTALKDVVTMCRRVGLVGRVFRASGSGIRGPAILHLTANSFVFLLSDREIPLLFTPLDGCVRRVDQTFFAEKCSGYYIAITSVFPVIEVIVNRLPHIYCRSMAFAPFSQEATGHMLEEETKTGDDSVVLKDKEDISCSYSGDLKNDSIASGPLEVTVHKLRHLHAQLNGSSKSSDFRNVASWCGGHNSIDHSYIVKYIIKWLHKFNSLKKDGLLNPLNAAYLYADLIAIRPFINNNTRLAAVLFAIPAADDTRYELESMAKDRLHACVYQAHNAEIKPLANLMNEALVGGAKNKNSFFSKEGFLINNEVLQHNRFEVLESFGVRVLRLHSFLDQQTLADLEEFLSKQRDHFIKAKVTGNREDFRLAKVLPGKYDILARIAAQVKSLSVTAARLLETNPIDGRRLELQLTVTDEGGYFLPHSDSGMDESMISHNKITTWPGVHSRVMTFVLYFGSTFYNYTGGNISFYAKQDGERCAEKCLSLPALPNSIVFFKAETVHHVETVFSLNGDLHSLRPTVNGWFHKPASTLS